MKTIASIALLVVIQMGPVAARAQVAANRGDCGILAEMAEATVEERERGTTKAIATAAIEMTMDQVKVGGPEAHKMAAFLVDAVYNLPDDSESEIGDLVIQNCLQGIYAKDGGAGW